MSDTERKSEKNSQTQDRKAPRRTWTPPKLDVLKVSETAGGLAGVPDAKGGGSLS